MRKVTDEQRAKTEARRARFAEIAKRVAEMDEAARLELVSRVGAVVTVEGRALSVGNSCMLVCQRENVSVVAGFQQWKRAGRSVKKGETGLMIWVPAGKKGEGEEVTGEAVEGEEAKARPRFVCGTVFDVSQTEDEAERVARRAECRCAGDRGAGRAGTGSRALVGLDSSLTRWRSRIE